MTLQFEKLKVDNAKLQVKHSTLIVDHAKLNDDFLILGANLQTANAVRVKAEENLEELNKQYRTVKDALVERDQMMIAYRSKYEHEAKLLIEV